MSLGDDLSRLESNELMKVLGMTIQTLGGALREVQDLCDDSESVGMDWVSVASLRRVIQKAKGGS